MSEQKEQQLLETVDRIIAEGPYQPTWSSLMQAKTPDWFKQNHFGIFIHWFTAFLQTLMNGIRGTCTSKECLHMNTM